MSAADAETPSASQHWIFALFDEFAEISFSGMRARTALIAALSSVLATLAAFLMHLDNPCWAAITGFVVSQATRAGSLRKGLLRISGTVGGAALAYFAMRWIGNNQLACYVFLLSVTTIGVTGFQVSENSYAWLLSAVTADLVVLSSLDDPTNTLHVAVYRTAEVAVGTLVAFLVTQALSPDAEQDAAPGALGWSSVFEPPAHALRHGLSCGVSLMLIPPIWHFFELPEIGAQMGVSVLMVSAAPIQSLDPSTFRRKVAERAQHRVFGCLAGGAAALVGIGLPLTELPPWLLALGAGIWLAAYLQASARGVGYIGTQFGIVYAITLVQGSGPSTSIWPGLDRLAGILCSLALLYVVAFALWSPDEPAEAAKDDAKDDAKVDPSAPPAYSLRIMFLPRAFDRSVYVDRLKQGGVDERQANLHADALEAALRDCVSKSDWAAALRDLDELRADLLQRLERAKSETAAATARSRSGLRGEFGFWTFLVAIVALAGVVLATTRLGR